MLSIDIKVDTKQVEKYLRDVQKKVIRQATVRSLNRTLDQVNTEASRTISKEMGMKVSAVKKRLKKIRARGSRFVAELRPDHYTPNLIEFGARQIKSGVSHKAWNKRQKHKSAFIGRGKNSGKLLVYARTTKKRYPIKALYGPTLQKTFIQRHVIQAMKKIAESRWAVNFERDFAFYLNKANS